MREHLSASWFWGTERKEREREREEDAATSPHYYKRRRRKKQRKRERERQEKGRASELAKRNGVEGFSIFTRCFSHSHALLLAPVWLPNGENRTVRRTTKGAARGDEH